MYTVYVINIFIFYLKHAFHCGEYLMKFKEEYVLTLCSVIWYL